MPGARFPVQMQQPGMMPQMQPGQAPQMVPGAMPAMVTMTPQQMQQMSPQQLAQMQMMMQAQMQMMMQAQMMMQQPGAQMPQQMPGFSQGQLPAQPGASSTQQAVQEPAQFNDLVTAFQQKNSISGGGNPSAGNVGSSHPAAAPAPSSSGNPFDMFG